MQSGVIILNKEENMSSQSAVNRLKRLLGAKKAGHTGTLDPLATGVLPILIERGVKASEYVTSEDKHYRATLYLGIESDTEDITGEIIRRYEGGMPSEEKVLSAIRSMVGEITQIPPMYSAIKIGGKKLYELARCGEVIDRPSRTVTIYSIKPTRVNEREYILDVHCSKGTYIRTLLADIGKALGTGAVMKTLTRTECAGFLLSDAHTLSEIEAMSEEERQALIIPTEMLFTKYRRVDLPPFFSRLARCGVEIYLKKIAFDGARGERVTLYDNGVFFALGEIREFDTGLAIKPIKQFDI